MNQGIINVAVIEEWISDNLSAKAVESSLISKGYDSDLVKQYVIEFKRLKRAKNYSFGLMLLTFCVQAGIIACFVALHKS